MLSHVAGCPRAVPAEAHRIRGPCSKSAARSHRDRFGQFTGCSALQIRTGIDTQPQQAANVASIGTVTAADTPGSITQSAHTGAQYQDACNRPC